MLSAILPCLQALTDGASLSVAAYDSRKFVPFDALGDRFCTISLHHRGGGVVVREKVQSELRIDCVRPREGRRFSSILSLCWK